MALSRSELHAVAAPRRRLVAVPEWGGDVLLVTLTTVARFALRNRLRDLVKDCPRDERGALVSGAKYDDAEARAIDLALLAQTVADETGVPAFTFEELDSMTTFPHDVVLSRLAAEAWELNGFSAGAVEDAAKKSDASPSST